MNGGSGLLGDRAFTRLWLASFCSESAEWMLQIALPVIVFQLTGSASLTATGMVLGLLPAVLLSPVAGVLADRRDRRVLLCAVGAAQLLAALPLLTVDGSGSLPIVYAVMAAQAACASLFEPARNALVPQLAGTERLTAANGLMGVNASVARLAGAWAGGTLLAFGGLPAVLYGYGLAITCAVLLLLPRFAVTRQVPSATPTPTSALRSWLDGLAEFRRNRTLRVTGAVFALMSLSQGMFLVLFVLFVLRTLDGSEADVGLLRGVQAVGGIAAGVALATIARRVAPATLLGCGAIVFGLLSFVVWNAPTLTTSISVYVVLFALVGIPGVVTMSGLTAVLQSAADTHMTGRVLSTALAGAAAFTVIGMQAAGALVDAVGLPALFGVQSMLNLVAGIIVVLCLVVRVTVRRRAPVTQRAP